MKSGSEWEQHDQREALSLNSTPLRTGCSCPELLLWAPHSTHQDLKMGALGGPMVLTLGSLPKP